MDSISNLLTDEILQSAPVKKKAYTIRDGRGLFVLMHPNGSRYFQLRATLDGKRKLMQLGVYPAISIDEARMLAVKRLQEASMPVVAQEGEFNFGLEDDAPGVKMEEAVNIVQEEEVRVILKEEDILAIGLDDNKVPTPKVSLHYSQLVYVPKTLPKTFAQKLAERIHPRVLWATFISKLQNLILKLKAKLAALLGQMQLVLKKWINRRLEKLIEWSRKIKLGLSSVHAGIKNKSLEYWISFKALFTRKSSEISAPSQEGDSHEIAFDHHAAEHVVEAPVLTDTRSEQQALLVIPHPQQHLLALSGACRLMLQKPQQMISTVLSKVRHLTQMERSADRADVIAVYGLFAESKGNYVIYTIKSLMACLLAKKD